MKLDTKALADKRIAELKAKSAKNKAIETPIDKEDNKQVSAYFKAMATRDNASLAAISKEVEQEMIAKGQTIGTNADGGFLVPTPLRAQIVEKMYDMSSIRPFATVINMDSPTLKVNTENAAPTVGYVAEEVTITESKQTYANDTLTAFGIKGLAGFSSESLLAAASNPTLQDHVINSFARAMSRFEDQELISGSGGGSAIEGIESFTPGATVTLTALVTSDKVIDAYYAMAKDYRGNAVWLMNDADRKVLNKLKDSNGRYIWTDGGGIEQALPTLMGRPVIVSNHVTADSIHFVDLSYYMVGDYAALRIDTGTNGTDFAKDRISVRFVKHTGGLLTNTAAYAKLANIDGSA